MSTTVLEERFLCLDLVHVSWVNASGRTSSHCAILTEIWSSGGLLQTDTAIPERSLLTLAAPNGSIQAHVSSCTQDNYGFLIQVTVDSPPSWFPRKYQPDHLLPRSADLGVQVSKTLLASERG
jgi:hypothetical protein